jgi:hypothetical protein
MANQPDMVNADIDHEAFMALARKANAGDALALTELRSALASNPSIAAHMGDLAAMTEWALLTESVKDDPSAWEIIKAKISQLRESLMGGSRSMIVRLAVDRVVLSWTAVYLFDLHFSDVAITQMSPPEAGLVIKQKLAAERRHEIALRNLARIRALVEPQTANSKRRAGQSLNQDSPLNVVR